MSAFQLLIRTTNSGTSSSTQFTLPGDSGETYDFVIDWGDGGADETINSGSSWTHTYSSGGDYTLSITESSTGGFPAIKFNNGGDKLKVLELANWGTNKWITFEDAFYGCSNLTITATDHATAVTGFVTDFSFAWRDNSLTSFPLIDTSSGTNFGIAWAGNTINTGDYNALLAGLSANANNSVTWGGGSSKYHDTGQTQRDILTAAPRNWTITDGGYDATYVPPSSGAPAQNAQHNNLRNIRMAP